MSDIDAAERPLTKAKAAMGAAKSLLDGAELDHGGLLPLGIAEDFARLMRIAEVHAMMAVAESLERLAAGHHI